MPSRDREVTGLQWALKHLRRDDLLADPVHRAQLAAQLKGLFKGGTQEARLSDLYDLSQNTVRQLLEEAECMLHAGRPPKRIDHPDKKLANDDASGSAAREVEHHDQPTTMPERSTDPGAELRIRTGGRSSAGTDRRESAEHGYRRRLAITLKQQHDNGATYWQLAQRYSIGQATVGRLLRRLANEIRAASEAGADVARLSHEYGVAPGVMQRWMAWAATVRRQSFPTRIRTHGELADLLQDRLDRVTSAVAHLPVTAAPRRRARFSTAGASLTQQQVGTFARVVGAALRNRRKALGWSPEHVVTVMQVKLSRQTIMAYELGTRAMTLARFVQYCVAIGANPGELISDAYLVAVPHTPDDPLTVDMAKLATTTRPELQGLCRWAETQAETLPRSAHGLVELSTPALAQLAVLSGLERQQLVDALRAI